MSYAVKEIFYTLQGEGRHAGRPAVFCRFAGCNLWSGREADRAEAVCQFCDTDFVGVDGPGGGKFEAAEDLADTIAEKWPSDDAAGKRFVVCTGGEPLLQLNEELIRALHERGFEIAVETNGTIAAPAGVDWVCVSPKQGAALRQTTGDELKLVFPQPGVDPRSFEGLAFLPAADGWSKPRDQHGACGAVLPGASGVAIEPADAQDSGHCIEKR
jgi:7-carboxy-7-deazaguanine synthase (Cx14CxxC type)